MSLFAQGIEEKLHRVQGDRETLEPAQPAAAVPREALAKRITRAPRQDACPISEGDNAI